MVNTEEFTKRLGKIMEFYDLSAAAFADRIDVGRSSISHLLSGRNKPSLDFVMKIIQAFPEVELYWLLNGKGKFPSGTSAPSTGVPQDLFTEVEKTREKSPESTPVYQGEKKKIEKIVIFYSDGSFEAYQN